MGMRKANISTDLIAGILKGFGDGPPRYFNVTHNALPADAKVVAVRNSPYWPGVVEVDVESSEWDEAHNGDKLDPAIVSVVHPPEIAHL